jgi:hypothetical protein
LGVGLTGDPPVDPVGARVDFAEYVVQGARNDAAVVVAARVPAHRERLAGARLQRRGEWLRCRQQTSCCCCEAFMHACHSSFCQQRDRQASLSCASSATPCTKLTAAPAYHLAVAEHGGVESLQHCIHRLACRRLVNRVLAHILKYSVKLWPRSVGPELTGRIGGGLGKSGQRNVAPPGLGLSGLLRARRAGACVLARAGRGCLQNPPLALKVRLSS